MWIARTDPPQHHQRHQDENNSEVTPVSRTMQYKKVMKPMLERKRRARINRCLDELKELMVGALEAEGENINKLEKADVLELTVRHLQNLQRQRRLVAVGDDQMLRFRAGFSHCAASACQYLMSASSVNSRVFQRLMSHLETCAKQLNSDEELPSPKDKVDDAPKVTPLSVQVSSGLERPYSPPLSLATPPTIFRPCQEDQYLHQPSISTSTEDTPYVISSTPSADDLSKPITGLLMVARPTPIRPEPQSNNMWRPW